MKNFKIPKFKDSKIPKFSSILILLLIFNFQFSIFNSIAQEPAWGTQAKSDSIEARSNRSIQGFRDAMDKFLIVDFAFESLKINALTRTMQFLQFPALNPELGEYLDYFENETGTSIIIRSFIDIDYFDVWVSSFRAAQKTMKDFEIGRANPAHAVIDIVYTPTGMLSKYRVAGFNIEVRDSLRTSAFMEIFSDEDFARMRDTIQNIMGTGPVEKIDSAGFNIAIIRGLEALKGDPGLKPDPVHRVTFRQGDAVGFDTYKYPALNSQYRSDATGNQIPWLALDANRQIGRASCRERV